jgi:protease I
MARKDGEMKVAILVDSGFEEEELMGPLEVLHEAGIDSHIVSPRKGHIRGWDGTGWGQEVQVDVDLADAKPDSYDMVLIPGAVMNPETLRRDRRAEAFIGSFFAEGKPVAALCRGPWTLINNASGSRRDVHDYRSVRTDVTGLITKMRSSDEEGVPAEELARVSDAPVQATPANSPARQQIIMWVNERHQGLDTA